MINKSFFYYWTGSQFCFPYTLSIKSILKNEEIDNLVVYFNDPVPQDCRKELYWNYLKTLPITMKEFCVRDFARDLLPDKFYDLFEEYAQSLKNPYRHFHMSDIARYLILYENGGVYQDFDTLTLKSLSPFLDKYDCYLPQVNCRSCTTFCGKELNITNGNLASVPKHDFYRSVLNLVYEILDKEKENIWQQKTLFGPMLVGTVSLEFPDVPFLDYKVFHSIGHKGSSPAPYYGVYYNSKFDISDEAYVLHFHTGKSQSRYRYARYLSPSDILRKKDKTNFCFYHSIFIDDDMLLWEKEILNATPR